MKKFILILSLYLLPASLKAMTIPEGNFLSLSPEDSCIQHISENEAKYNIPNSLLHAIAKAESGHPGKKGTPWPWTINVEGKGYFYETKAEAIAAVKKFQAAGKRSIDVGCMQINLHHHPKAFPDLKTAFTPKDNTAYAGEYLAKLNDTHRSWKTAVQRYHSAGLRGIKYGKNVFRIWAQERGIENSTHLTHYTLPQTPLSPQFQRLAHFAKKYKATLVASRTLNSSTKVSRISRINRHAFKSSRHIKRIGSKKTYDTSQ